MQNIMIIKSFAYFFKSKRLRMENVYVKIGRAYYYILFKVQLIVLHIFDIYTLSYRFAQKPDPVSIVGPGYVYKKS